jgi:SAM-dependent methyltransferase
LPSDSSVPEFWDTRFRGGVTPWDAGGAPPRLAEWLRHRAQPMRVLIPGAGTGYEAALFAEHGHDVVAIDFSDAAVEAAQRRGHGVLKADFFAYPEKDFDLLYERAFLCALPRRLWPRWAGRVAQLVRPGGELAGFFYLDDNERGPPFGTSRGELAGLRAGAFDLAEEADIPAGQSLPVFKGKEIWQVWKRRL